MFIAMNRFQVRQGREADFEAQWRTRDTYIKNVPGFISFALLRNEPMPAGHGHGAPQAQAHGHEHAHGHDHDAHGHGHGHESPAFTEYVSHTTWRSKADFDAWRRSEAFRLAHAQGSIEGVLMGPPVPSLYEAVIEEVDENVKAS